MNRTTEKYPQNKIDGLNLIEDIKVDIITLFSPIMLQLKLKVDGNFDKKSSALINPIYDQLRLKYGNNFRIYLDAQSATYWCFKCDLWVVTEITTYENNNMSPDHRGDYLKFYINYSVDQGLFSDYEKREKITKQSLLTAQQQHKKLRDQLKEIESMISSLEREYKIDKYGSFV